MSETIDTTANVSKNTRLFGVVTIILGVLAIAAPLAVGVSIALLVGLLVLLAGLGRIILVYQSSKEGKDLQGLSIGILMLLCGIILLTDPLLASGLLTIILAAYFIIDGAFEIAAAFRLRPLSGWLWLLTGGIISLLLGIFIWLQYPLSGAWAIGVLLGIKLLFVGVTMFSYGTILQSGPLSKDEN